MNEEALNLEDLTGPLAEVLHYWTERGGPDLACSWSDIHLYELPPAILPTTMVIDVFPELDKNVFRYWGSNMTDVHGRDMTGECPYELEPKNLAQRIRLGHAAMAKEPKASASVFGYQHAKGYLHTHSVLRLPLSDDGKTLHQILVVTLFADLARPDWDAALVEMKRPG